MSQVSQKARPKAAGRQKRERSTAAAVGWSILTAFGVALVIFCVEFFSPGAALRNFWQLVYVNGQVSPSSPLFQSLQEQVGREDALFVMPLSLLCGGVALGRLAPRTVSRKNLLLIPVGITLICNLIRWGIIVAGILLAAGKDSHHIAGIVDWQIIRNQAFATIGWILAFIIGTGLGTLWRDARRRQDDKNLLTGQTQAAIMATRNKP